MKYRMLVGALLLVTLIAMGGVGIGRSLTTAQVTLHIFSGMPDPSWELTSPETRELEARLAALVTGKARPMPQHLGYRGVEVVLATTTGAIERLRIYDGVLRHEKDEGISWYQDPGRAMERWLLRTGNAQHGLIPRHVELIATTEASLAQVEAAAVRPVVPPPTITPIATPENLPAGFALCLTEEVVGITAPCLFTNSDVVAYNPRTTTFTLTQEAYTRVTDLKVPVRGLRFAVYAAGEHIYSGALWTPLSSLSYEGIVIQIAPVLEPPPTLHLQLAYPESPELFEGKDLRNDPRILKALEDLVTSD